MRKWIILAVVVVALGAAAAIAFVNLNSYLNRNRDWIAARATSALGRSVAFDEIGVSFSGGFGARVKNLRVADDARFSKGDFVRAGDVQVLVRIIPALFGRYEVRRIVLDRPVVNVIHEESGFNFDSIGKNGAAAAPGPARAPAPPPAPGSPAPPAAREAAFFVGLINVEDGVVRYVDRAAKPPTDVSITKLRTSVSDLSLTSAIHLKTSAALFDAAKENVRFEGDVGPLGSPPDVQHAKVEGTLELGPIAIDELKKLPAAAKALPPELSSPDPITLRASVNGTPADLALEAHLDASDAAIAYGTVFTKPKGTPFKLDLAATRGAQAVEVKSLALRLAALDLAGKGTIGAGPSPVIGFQLDSKPTELAGWDKLLPAFAGHQVSGTAEVHLRASGKAAPGQTPALAGTVALVNVSARQAGSPYEIDGLSTTVELKGDSVVVPPTSFKLGGSPVELQATVDSVRGRSGEFTLKSPSLRLASLALADKEAKKEEVVRGLETHGRFRAAEGAPEFSGTLASSDGSLRGVDYQALAAEFGLRQRVATLSKLALRAYDGSYSGAGRYDMNDPQAPKFDFKSTIRDMALKGLLAGHFPNAENKIDGRLDADLELAGAGKQWEAIKTSLRGDGGLDVRQGVLKDVNLAEDVLNGVTGVPGLSNFVSPRTRAKYPELFATGDTRFDKLGGTVQIANGVARTDDLTLAARDYTILGKGTFSLDNQLDFTATLVASQQLTDDIVADVREAKYVTDDRGRVAIPFRVAGALPKVRPKPDTEFVTKAIARAALGKGLEKIFGKQRTPAPGATPGPERPEDVLKRGLQGLFGR